MDLCTLLLMDDSNYPCWLVLVPQRNDIKVHARWMPPPQQLSCTDTIELSHELLGFQQAKLPVQEVIDLSEHHQRKLWEEVSHVCRAVRSSFEPGLKLNIAAIGNVVRTLAHITLRTAAFLPVRAQAVDVRPLAQLAQREEAHKFDRHAKGLFLPHCRNTGGCRPGGLRAPRRMI